MPANHAAQQDAMEMRATAQRYTGPSAGQIVNRLPHRVTLEKGWLRTTTAICHGGDEPDGLAFRQRPDGNGIDVRCHTGGCTRAQIITAIEGLIGLPIWTAYEPVEGTPAAAPPVTRWTKVRRWLTPHLTVWAVGAPMLALPLALGHGFQAALLNFAAFGVAVALLSGLPGMTRRAFRA